MPRGPFNNDPENPGAGDPRGVDPPEHGDGVAGGDGGTPYVPAPRLRPPSSDPVETQPVMDPPPSGSGGGRGSTGRAPGTGRTYPNPGGDPGTPSTPPLPPSRPTIPTIEAPRPGPSRTDTFTPVKDPLPVIYGPMRTGAFIVFDWVHRWSGRRIVVYEVCYGPINSLGNIKVEGKLLSFYGMTLGVDCEVFLGTASQPKSNIMTAYVGASWVSAKPGIAYVVCAFPRPTAEGQPAPDVKSFVCDVEGMLVFDPVADPTLTTRFYRPYPALCLADFMMSTRYGGGEAKTSFDWTSTITDSFNFESADLGSGRRRFTFGLKIDGSRGYDEWIEVIRAHGQLLQPVFNNGLWQIITDKSQASLPVAITNANIVSVTPLRGHGPEQIITAPVVHFINTDAEYKDDTAEDPDPGIATGTVQETRKEWFLGAMPFDQAKRIARYFRKESQVRDHTGEVRMFAQGARILPGSVVPITSDQWSCAAQTFFVRDVWPEGLGWRLQVSPTSDAIFDYSQQTTTNYNAPVSPSPYDAVPQPTGLSATERRWIDQFGKTQSSIVVDWINGDTPFYRATRIFYQRAGGTQQLFGDFAKGPVEIPATLDVVQYTITAFTLTTITPPTLSASATATCTTQGKTSPPANVPFVICNQLEKRVRVSWQAAPDRDVVEYEVRRGLTTDTFATASRVGKYKTLEAFDEPPAVDTVYRYFVVASDGVRYSTTPATFDIRVFFFGAGGTQSLAWPWTANPAIYGTGNKAGDAIWFGPGPSHIVLEGATVQRSISVFLCRLLGPVSADSEISANGLTTIQQWEASIDAPRRNGCGIWAPLNLDANGTTVGRIFSDSEFGGDGGGYRNSKWAVRVDGVQRIGLSSDPAITTKLEPIAGVNSAPWASSIAPNTFIASPFSFDQYGAFVRPGVQISTNSRYAQEILVAPVRASAFRYSVMQEQHPLGSYDATSVGGVATVVLPASKQLLPGQVPAVSPIVIGGIAPNLDILSLSNTTVQIRTRDASGALVSGVVLRVTCVDAGGGGLTYETYY